MRGRRMGISVSDVPVDSTTSDASAVGPASAPWAGDANDRSVVGCATGRSPIAAALAIRRGDNARCDPVEVVSPVDGTGDVWEADAAREAGEAEAGGATFGVVASAAAGRASGAGPRAVTRVPCGAAADRRARTGGTSGTDCGAESATESGRIGEEAETGVGIGTDADGAGSGVPSTGVGSSCFGSTSFGSKSSGSTSSGSTRFGSSGATGSVGTATGAGTGISPAGGTTAVAETTTGVESGAAACAGASTGSTTRSGSTSTGSAVVGAGGDAGGTSIGAGLDAFVTGETARGAEPSMGTGESASI